MRSAHAYLPGPTFWSSASCLPVEWNQTKSWLTLGLPGRLGDHRAVTLGAGMQPLLSRSA